MIKKISTSHPLAFSFAATFLVISLFTASMFLFAAIFKVDITNPEMNISFYSASILSKIIFTSLTMYILFDIKMLSVIRPTSKGLLKGLVLGWFFILGGILLFAGKLDFSKISSIEQSKWILVLFVAAETFLAGISEEFLCRGLLYNTIFNKHRSVKKVVFISSAIFGAVHLMNLIYQPALDTLVQVVYAFSFGILLAAIYVRCENIWTVVLLHAFWNFANSAPAILTPSDIVDGSSDITAIIPIFVISILSVCLGLFLIRKKKTEDTV